MKQTKAEKAKQKTEALAYLRKNLKKGDTIYTALRHKNAMGTYRVASHYIVKRDTIIRIDHYVCWLLDQRWDDRHEGVSYPNHQPPGDVAYNLSWALHGHKEPICKCEERLAAWHLLPLGTRPFCPAPCCHKPGYTLRHEWL